MRKKILALGSILMLLGSFFLINQLQNKSFNVFNAVSEEQIQQIQNELEETERFSFTALLCNEIRVPFDDTGKTFYVPLDMESEKWEKLEFTSGQSEYHILFSEDITECDKKSVISEGRKIPLIVYDQNYWAQYYIVFSGIPIIDLATNEGFWNENITGSAVFYDTDFTLHGTEYSEYNAHIRGNTSRMFPKKGYKLNLTKQSGDETVQNKISLFGMRKDEDWILHALYNDDTKIRDRFSMAVWEKIGAKAVSKNAYYGSKMTYVEVFADNSYCGLYGLLEPIDAKQLDLQTEDYSYKRKNPGGLIYQYFSFYDEKNPYAEVEGFEIKDGQMTERAWRPMANLCAILTLEDEEFVEKKSEIINIDSALRLWIFLQMITGHDHTAKNVFYIAKASEEARYGYQFYFAPWDLDLTWGNVSVGEINSVYTEFKEETIDDKVAWETGDRLIDLNYKDSRERMLSLYEEYRNNVLSNDEVENMILTFDHQVRDSGAFERDKARWTDSVHAENCEVLLEYAKDRLNFLDKALYNFDYFNN